MSLGYKICLWGVVCTLTIMIRNGSFEHLDNVKNYPEANQNTQQLVRIYKPGGKDVQLQCNNNEDKTNRQKKSTHGVVWHYKHCGKNEGLLPCNDSQLPENDWAVYPCMHKSRCKATLDLGKATENDNGLYRCSIRNKSPVLKILTIFELEINDNAPDLDSGPDMDNAPDYSVESPEPPVRIFRPSGGEVHLQCKSTVKTTGLRKSQGIIWHYKKCGFRYNLPKCNQFVEETDLSDWQIMGHDGKEYRDKTLNLGRPKEDDNGLYRCSIKNKEMAKIIVTYELDIVDKANTAEILQDSPRNLTVHSGQSAPFQCHVYSNVKPTIMWLRKWDTVVANAKVIQYLNDTWEQMKSDQISFRVNGLYLSKLVLPMASQSDAGIYACVVINNAGVTNRTAYLTVLPKYFSNNATLSEFEMSSLNWLFLIPAALALIPATVWLCCLWRRRTRQGHTMAASMEANHLQSNSNNNNLRKQGGSGFKYMPVSETQNNDPKYSFNREELVFA